MEINHSIKFMNMNNMKNILSIAVLLAGLGLMTTCQHPDPLTPSVVRMGINSVTVSFADGTGSFTAETPETGNEIVVYIPYFFPENSENRVTEEMTRRMRIRANLDNNVTVSPPLLYMDMTQSNRVTVTDAQKVKKEYVIRGEIRRSNACFIEDFTISAKRVSGIINESEKLISLPMFDTSEPLLAELRLSPHATVSPDPRVTPLDWSVEQQLTVTAHDGATQSVYTVKLDIPEKLPFGIRTGSARIMFAKQLRADLGIAVNHLTGGIAVTDEYVILNTRGENSVFIDSKTGEKLGGFDGRGVKGHLRNYYATAHRAGNVLICNLAQNDGTFKVWRLKSMTGDTELYIDWPDNTEDGIGRKISVQGDIDEDAIITAPLYGAANQRFARWVVVGGELTSQEPEIIVMSGLERGWTTNADLVYTSGSDLNADYFVASYSDNTFAWVNGQTHQVRRKLAEIERNFVPNAVDFIEFNNAKYATLNWVNGFTWGSADVVWLLDVSSEADFTGDLAGTNCPAVVWQTPRDTYGAKAIQPVVENANITGDVALSVSADGYYLYLYFMFTNGFVVGVQFDFIDM